MEETTNKTETTNTIIEKPFSIIKDNFVKDIEKIINSSGLHIGIVAMIMNDINTQVQNMAYQQSIKEHTQYENEIVEKSKKETCSDIEK